MVNRRTPRIFLIKGIFIHFPLPCTHFSLAEFSSSLLLANGSIFPGTTNQKLWKKSFIGTYKWWWKGVQVCDFPPIQKSALDTHTIVSNTSTRLRFCYRKSRAQESPCILPSLLACHKCQNKEINIDDKLSCFSGVFQPDLAHLSGGKLCVYLRLFPRFVSVI